MDAICDVMMDCSLIEYFKVTPSIDMCNSMLNEGGELMLKFLTGLSRMTNMRFFYYKYSNHPIPCWERIEEVLKYLFLVEKYEVYNSSK